MAYINAIKEAKPNSFREFCEGIEQTTEASRLCKIIANDRGISPVCLKKVNGIFTENEEGRVHLLFRTLSTRSYPTAVGENILPDTLSTNRRERENLKLAKELCSKARVRSAMGIFKP